MASQRQVESASTLLAFLEQIGVDPRIVAVERNGEIVKRTRFGETIAQRRRHSWRSSGWSAAADRSKRAGLTVIRAQRNIYAHAMRSDTRADLSPS